MASPIAPTSVHNAP